MQTYVVHDGNTGRANVVKAASPSAALRQFSQSPIRTEAGSITAGKFSVAIPGSWR